MGFETLIGIIIGSSLLLLAGVIFLVIFLSQKGIISANTAKANGSKPAGKKVGRKSKAQIQTTNKLLSADVSRDIVQEIAKNVKKDFGVNDLTQVLVQKLKPEWDRNINYSTEKDLPTVILVVGVNGVGKTTTIGKLGLLLAKSGKKIVLAAADTFRAAASEQLVTWCDAINQTLTPDNTSTEKVDTPNAQTSKNDLVSIVTAKKDGQDPASVAFEASEKAVREKADLVIIDTAGRLHNEANLMNELAKIKRVTQKNAPISEILLVIDATTGQNAITQAEEFAKLTGVTGIVLTKLDGVSGGGVILQIQEKLGIPVKFVGLGEGIDDFAQFDVKKFAQGLAI